MISVPSAATNGFNVKQLITQAEFEVLDKLACAADRLNEALESFLGLKDMSIEGIRGAQGHLVEAVESHLAIDAWDQDKRKIVFTFVHDGVPNPIEHLLELLDIVVSIT